MLLLLLLLLLNVFVDAPCVDVNDLSVGAEAVTRSVYEGYPKFVHHCLKTVKWIRTADLAGRSFQIPNGWSNAAEGPSSHLRLIEYTVIK